METTQFLVQSPLNYIEKASFTWKTPSNIALVKYWGKTDPQIPKNASISFTLKHCHTITTIDFTKKTNTQNISFELYFEGVKNDAFKPKIAHFFNRIKKYCPYIFEYDMLIHSQNSFPHSSGIASSASGLSAIAMCMLSLEKEIANINEEDLVKKASFLARLGSGSASRSIEGPLVVWGQHPDINESSDLYGVQFPFKVAPIFQNYQDVILLVDKGEKQVSSSVGHGLMHQHPYAENRFLQANQNLGKITNYLKNGDVKNFINLVESEALTLHAMMLTSNPYFILMKPNTLEIINRIWNYRKEKNSNICFTLDAGANVHVLFPENEQKSIVKFIDNELSRFCQKKQYICDEVSLGAVQL